MNEIKLTKKDQKIWLTRNFLVIILITLFTLLIILIERKLPDEGIDQTFALYFTVTFFDIMMGLFFLQSKEFFVEEKLYGEKKSKEIISLQERYNKLKNLEKDINT